MDRQALFERYTKLDWSHQVGNLASTLARISSRALTPRYDTLVTDLLREAALFIEWSAASVPQSLLLDLASLQSECLAWQRVWPPDASGLPQSARSLLALYARNASDRLLYRIQHA